ncbi:MAG TPA: cupin domain-containing protein [Amaricoccus sp.]|uniref:cupin domain-containing protein n=1 Tax=Amaricoccus sp. TaxID=1872485 RepID=UPI002CD13F1E|nr:cupin domain-containing protein [Amaricoccus sp.]HMQ93164.1 cupin domain-containing protein [Amaricoccus sp.]HMR53946.1 cupin domain-containing protein [Amaricoccus sp.]HMR60190.1 cupin domain-containing protein [Amaricoccus sp.]HMU00942.1 cupin domain-containing protein [Amaricoccus sp.]
MTLIDHASQAREDWRPGVSTRMRVSALTGASALSVFEQWCAPGLGAPTHWHRVEEVLTVLSGEAEIWTGGERVLARAGQSALIPAGSRHGFRNAGSGELHMLAVLASPIFEARYDDSPGVTRRWIPGSGGGQAVSG